MKKILLIDDDEDLSAVVKTILNADGFEVYVHPTSFNVTQIVKDYNPNLILIDIMLYGKTGMEICRELKRIYSIPVVLFSSDTTKGKAFEDCDADGFIEKPFEVHDLLDKIKSHLKYSYSNYDSLPI